MYTLENDLFREEGGQGRKWFLQEMEELLTDTERNGPRKKRRKKGGWKAKNTEREEWKLERELGVKTREWEAKALRRAAHTCLYCSRVVNTDDR